MSKKRARRPLSPLRESFRLLVRLAPEDVAMFRFLLEARDNLAGFTVLDRREALLKVFGSAHQEQAIYSALREIGESLKLEILPWPGSGNQVQDNGGQRDSQQAGPAQMP